MAPEPIPDLDTCDRLLDAIDASSTAKEQSPLIERLVAAHKTINVALGRGSPFWRARRCGPGGFPQEQDLWYPPPHLCGAQRLNDKGQPVLYLSSRRETALAEIGALPGDLVHLGGFRIKPNASLRIASVGEWHQVHKRGSMRFGPPGAGNEFSRIMNSADYENGRLLIYVDAILGDLLARPDANRNEYLSTRLLINAIYAKHPTIDGIAYPSVKDAGLNLAVRSHAADNAVENCASIVVEIQGVRRYGVYEYRTIRAAQGVNTDSSFVWAPTCEPHEQIIYGITKEEDEAGVIPYAKVVGRGKLIRSKP